MDSVIVVFGVCLAFVTLGLTSDFGSVQPLFVCDLLTMPLAQSLW